jgi:putative DNA primase/helicase
MLDLDDKLASFLVSFPQLAEAPRVVRPGTDRGKILVQVNDPPNGRKWHRGLNGPIEFLSTGQQGVLPPSKHPSGDFYEWAGGLSLPNMTIKDLRMVVEAWTGTPWPSPGEGPQGPAEAADPPPPGELEVVLQSLPQEFCEDYETWRDVGMAIHSAYSDERGLRLWDEWSKGSPKWKPGQCQPKWRTFGSFTGTPVTWRSLYWWSDEAKIVEMMEPSTRPSGVASATRSRVTELVDSGAFPASDVGLGELFASLYSGQVKYVPTHGWYIWNGRHWESDRRLAVYRKAFALYKSALREINRKLVELTKEKMLIQRLAGDAIDLAQASQRMGELSNKEKSMVELKGAVVKLGLMPKLEAALKAAMAQPEIIAEIDEFDVDPWVLNVHNGILDLRTRELTPHLPERMCSKMAQVNYDPAAKCPLWEKFVQEVFVERSSDGSLVASPELMQFVARSAGFTLQGQPMRDTDQIFFFAHGAGSNGKSTFVGLVAEMLGTYAVTIRSTALMIQVSRSQAEDIAHMPGARMAVSPELPLGCRMDESLVKSLTGDSIVRARHLYKSSFEFVPRAKLWMHGNHRPEIRDAGEGTWRRIMLLPFEARFAEDRRDTQLPVKLLEERPGILNWALAGLTDWLENGLQVPGTIKAAVQEYREEENRFEQFIDEYCEWTLGARVEFKKLYVVYKKWCDDNGELPLRPKGFSAMLEQLAKVQEWRLVKARIGNTKGFQGITLTKEGQIMAEMLTAETMM